MENAFTDFYSRIARIGGIAGVFFCLSLYGFSVWHGDPTLSAGDGARDIDLLLMLGTSIAFYVAGRWKRRVYESLAITLFGALFVTRGILRLITDVGSTVDVVMSGIVPSFLGAVFVVAGILVYVGREELLSQ